MSDRATRLQSRLQNGFNWAIFFGTVGMTYLTVAKEKVMYQNERHNWRVLVYLVATQLYYPLLVVNLALIAVAGWQTARTRHAVAPVAAAWLVFVFNVILFSANNVLNLLEGRPLHHFHEGIGW